MYKRQKSNVYGRVSWPKKRKAVEKQVKYVLKTDKAGSKKHKKTENHRGALGDGALEFIIGVFRRLAHIFSTDNQGAADQEISGGAETLR